ncbi:MAG: hypothetical protein ABIG71_04175 [Candidatus Uhrbacteria bacterium]
MQIAVSRLQRIPKKPGIYTFTKRGVPIYVGKARDLRARLAAYKPGGDWKAEMLAEATGLRVETTKSELEALLLEAARIRALQPKWNLRQRDDKSFVYICITTDEDFPQVLIVRSFRRAGTYIGPFVSTRAVRETLKALRRVFPYRCNGKPKDPTPSPRPRRTKKHSPSRREGEKVVRACLHYHIGLCAGTCAGVVSKAEYRRRVINPLVKLLQGETTSARRMLDSTHRTLLDQVLEESRVLETSEKYELDLLELQRVLNLVAPPHRIEGYDISNIQGRDAVGSLVVAIDGEMDSSEYKRFRIRTLEGQSNDVGMLREVLERRITHMPIPATTHVRASRLSSRNNKRDGEKSEWPLPDLIVVDGGKPQLNGVVRTLRGAGIHIPIVSLAKRDEEIFLPGERFPLRLPKSSPALHLLQRVRDEAHRFAVDYHRKRRMRRTLNS